MRLLLAALLFAAPALAEPSWPDLREALFGEQPLRADEVVRLDAPYRTDNDARTVLGVTIAPEAGVLLRKVTLVIDENPMPVSAVLTLARPQPSLRFDATMRINGPTPVHVVAETVMGDLHVAETFVKTSGQGACAAPPGTDPEEALATLGRMRLGLARGDLAARLGRGAARRVQVDIDHPSHSGMQMDQISLLFIPMRHVATVDMALDGEPYATLEGGISWSENPSLTLSIPDSAQSVQVEMTDTEGARSRAEMALPAY